MLDHIDLAVADPVRSRAFYLAVLATLGYGVVLDIVRDDGRQGTGFGPPGEAQFWIGGGEPARGRVHVAFRAPSQEAVDAFHRAALAAGAVDHGAPGPRPQYGDHCYAAFVRDPDGHVIEAMCRVTG